jgi:lipid-binding SYLF domain-containing protein
MQTQVSTPRTVWLAPLAFALACTALVGCTITGSKDRGSSVAQRRDIEAGVDATLSRLYDAAPQSRQLVARASGVLVFPKVLSASFIVGAEHGNGTLRVAGKTEGYYDISAGSIGLQAGAQSKAIVLLFMTPDALAKFRNAKGWTVGADATVAVAHIGANGSIDTNTAQQPVVGFVLSNAGLMAGISLVGAKISKLNSSEITGKSGRASESVTGDSNSALD